MLGPGKAELLELIRDQGSISAAGRGMRMSWKRAWSLVDELNHAFRLPLVEAARGGAAGGGAHLTATGIEVLALYRRLESRLAEDGGAELRALNALVREAGDVSGKE
jgi:molybdate transport system regulatory protein